jgi:hypothetical protein
VEPKRMITSVQVNRRLSIGAGAIEVNDVGERPTEPELLRATVKEKEGTEIIFVKQTQNQNDKNLKP